MIPCHCQTTGHEPGCLNGLDGYYVNGVKVAALPPPRDHLHGGHMSAATDLLLATARNAAGIQAKRIRDALKADMKRMAMAAAGTETGQALLAAAPREAQEFLANLMAEDADTKE